jgi:transcriptional regulator with XRE-family HTH domain
MKLLVDRAWLRNKILTDPDIDTDAGVALAVLEGLGVSVPAATENEAAVGVEKVRQLRIALGALIRQLRNRDRLSVSDLAKQATVAEDEIRSIEHDPHYLPRPRTLHKLAGQFKLPVRQLLVMSGATRTVDRTFYNEAVRFAAHADDVAALDKHEMQILHAFVKFIDDRDDT